MSASTVVVLLALALGIGAVLVLAGGLAVAGVLLVARLVILRDDARAAERAAAIARDIIATRDAIEPPSKTEKRAIEQAMMTLAGQRERVDEDLGRLQHLIDGGRFDDSPTKWKAKKESKA